MVNVVMIAKDRTRLTRQALESLFNNTPPELFNLTVVDDSSCDCYPDYLETEVYCDGYQAITVRISQSRGIVGLVRNIGADFAQRYWGRGDWLYFSDNDVCFHEGWLGKMVAFIENAQYTRILGGCQHPFHGTNGVEWVITNRLPTVGKIQMEQATMATAVQTDAVAGYSMLMSWQTWDKYGPFDQHAVGVGQSEDFAVCQKVLKDGYRVGYVSPPVLTVTGLTNTLGGKVPGWEQLKALVPEGVIAE